MKGSKASILLVAIGGIGLILWSGVMAQPPPVLSISPLTFEIIVNPGESISNVVKVTNLSGSPVQIEMEAQDFTTAGEAGEVVVKEEISETYSLAKWVGVEPETFELEPYSQKLVNFSITVPAGGEPGGHYGTILASTVGGGVPGGAMVVQKVGALLLVQVTGEVKELIWLKDFEAPQFSEYGPIEFTARFENRGTVHLKPRGFISITNWLGKEVTSLPIPQKNVLPNSVREISTKWDTHWLLGRYTATLAAIYGTTNESTSGVINFWVIPWRVLSVVAFVILVFGIFFYKSRRRWKAALKVLIKGEKAG